MFPSIAIPPPACADTARAAVHGIFVYQVTDCIHAQNLLY